MTHSIIGAKPGAAAVTRQDIEALTTPTVNIAGLSPERLYSTKEVARITGFTESAFEAWRLRGAGGPPFRKLGVRAVRYLGQDVIEWVAGGRRKSTSEVVL